MQIKDVRPESFVKQLRCDRCARLAEADDGEFHEFVSIDMKAGYGSIFGDGEDVQIDLCQHCLKSTLGSWLRVSNAEARQSQLIARLSLFDPTRHGGEFPAGEESGLQAPKDLPIQERPGFTSMLRHQLRWAQHQCLTGAGFRLLRPSMTGAVCVAPQWRLCLARLSRARRRRQAEFIRRGKLAVERSEAAGDGIPAEVVLAKLMAKVEAARRRKFIGLLKSKIEVPADFDDPLPEDVLRDFERGSEIDARLTVKTRLQRDPAIAEALLDEAIDQAARGDSEAAKRILRDLIDTARRNP